MSNINQLDGILAQLNALCAEIPATDQKALVTILKEWVEAKETAEDDDEFCRVCGQEHNCWHEWNAGRCQHCREPIADYSTGEFYK